LVELLVFGRRSGEAASAHSKSLRAQLREKRVIDAAHDDLDSLIREGEEVARPLQRALRNTMWELCGVVRDEERMREGLDKLVELSVTAAKVDVRPTSEGHIDLALALDLRGSLAAAEATLRSAIERAESRGAHQRSDYPEPSTEPVISVVVGRDESGDQVVSARSVPPMPGGLAEWVKMEEDLTIADRLLE
ncbi:MAG: succinate dehydrogenase, partial [Anaerolineae bacterium]